MHTLHTLAYNKLIMRKKSGVGIGESGVGNQSGSFSVAHTGNAKIWKAQRPKSWEETSRPLGLVVPTGGTTIASVASYAICRKQESPDSTTFLCT